MGISCDTPAENLAFQQKFNFPYDLLSDVDRAVSVLYGAAEDEQTQYPARISYLINADGVISQVFPKVVPADHADEILALLA